MHSFSTSLVFVHDLAHGLFFLAFLCGKVRKQIGLHNHGAIQPEENSPHLKIFFDVPFVVADL